MLFLGFLKFLKRDKKKEPNLGLEKMEDLDVPPPLPDLGESDLGELPELPELPNKPVPGMEEKPLSEIQFPEEEKLPEIGLPMEKPLPGLEFPEEKPVPRLELPPLPSPKKEEPMEIPKAQEFPEFPEIEPRVQRPRPLFPVEMSGVQRPRIVAPKFPPKIKPRISPYGRLEKAAVREERAVLRHEGAEGQVYIRIDRFKDILNGTKIIKNDLKTASQSIVKLNEMNVNNDKVFEKWHSVMTDLQKKLIFMDKTLFKR